MGRGQRVGPLVVALRAAGSVQVVGQAREGVRDLLPSRARVDDVRDRGGRRRNGAVGIQHLVRDNRPWGNHLRLRNITSSGSSLWARGRSLSAGSATQEVVNGRRRDVRNRTGSSGSSGASFDRQTLRHPGRACSAASTRHSAVQDVRHLSEIRAVGRHLLDFAGVRGAGRSEVSRARGVRSVKIEWIFLFSDVALLALLELEPLLSSLRGIAGSTCRRRSPGNAVSADETFRHSSEALVHGTNAPLDALDDQGTGDVVDRVEGEIQRQPHRTTPEVVGGVRIEVGVVLVGVLVDRCKQLGACDLGLRVVREHTLAKTTEESTSNVEGVGLTTTLLTCGDSVRGPLYRPKYAVQRARDDVEEGVDSRHGATLVRRAPLAKTRKRDTLRLRRSVALGELFFVVVHE